MSGDTVGWWLRRLSEIGYVNITKSVIDKRVNIYNPLVVEEEKQEILRVLEDRESLRSKLKEGFENWLEKDEKEREFYKCEMDGDEVVFQEVNVSTVKEDVNRDSSGNIPSDLNSFYSGLFLVKSQKQIEDDPKEENRGFSGNLRVED